MNSFAGSQENKKREKNLSSQRDNNFMWFEQHHQIFKTSAAKKNNK